MKSINGVNWKKNIVPERLILKNKQDYNISYLLSKIFLDNKYNDEEIQNSIFNFSKTVLPSTALIGISVGPRLIQGDLPAARLYWRDLECPTINIDKITLPCFGVMGRSSRTS